MRGKTGIVVRDVVGGHYCLLGEAVQTATLANGPLPIATCHFGCSIRFLETSLASNGKNVTSKHERIESRCSRGLLCRVSEAIVFPGVSCGRLIRLRAW